MREGKPEAAATVFRQLLRREPSDAVVQSQLARALARMRDRTHAIYYAERAGGSKNPDAVEEAAYALGELGENEKAMRLLRRAVELNPAQASAMNSLAIHLQTANRIDEACEMIGRASATAPNDPAIAANLALVYAEGWRLEEGLDLVRSARERNPGDASLQYALAFLSNYSDRMGAAQVFEEHRRYASLLARRVTPPAAPPLRQPVPSDADRPLRVGFVSPDFRGTSVSRFLEPILREHDRDTVRYILYPLVREEDETTVSLRGWGDGWNQSAMLPDAQAASAIRSDAIDVLIDLCGLTRGCCPGLFMARAAPVQVTYLGYPNTTAFPNMDVRIVDSITDPAGAEALATERLERLDPSFLCFAPDARIKDTPPRGDASAGPVTFVCFNNMMKTTPTTLGMWGAIMRRLPDARLLLKASGLSAPGVRERVMNAASSAGWADRLELHSFIGDLRDHLRLYHRGDIALDPYPYHGTTTTCEVLYMGLPVITLAGDRHAARVGASLLRNVGAPELIAWSQEQYVEKALDLAGSIERRTEYHRTLRRRLMASPLGDAPSFARGFEALLRRLWRVRCGLARA